jgi:hypothetical protein
MIIIQKNNYLLKLMQNDQNKYIKDDIAHRNANENNENIPFKRKMKISDKNQVLNGFFSENDIQVFKPIPIKTTNQPNDKNFLCKKRSEHKGLYEYNNLFKNCGGNDNNCVSHSFICNNNIKYQAYPLIMPNLINIKENFSTSKERYNHKNKKIHKPMKSQMKTIVIINNYINIDKSFLTKDQENDKKLFGIFNDDSILKKNDDKIKTSNLKINTNTDKLENNGNKTTITHSIGSKKFNIIKTDDLDGDFNYDLIRKIPKKKKRGRKPKKLSKRIHNALDQDNIIRKIQVHFLSFIIFFCNDLIQTILPNNKDLVFKNIVYEIKKTVNHAYIENLKSKSIGDILQLKASPKNKKFNDNINKIIFDKICTLNPFLKKFFEISYLDMFNNYYCRNEREIDVEGYHVKLSNRTRLFVDLIEKNQSSKKIIEEISERYFFNKEKNLNPIFVIQKEKNL